MSLYAACVTQGTEFALVEDCTALGIEAIAPRRVDAVRTGKKRWPEPKVSPYLPGYVFTRLTPEHWHWTKDIRYLRSLLIIPPQAERSIQAFIDRVEGDYAQRMAQIEAGERLAQYCPGDLLSIIAGPFAGELARFSRMIEKAAAMFPEIEASMPIMGGETKMRLDPLSVRRAT